MPSFNQNIKQSIIWRGFYFFAQLLLNIFLSRYLNADGIGVIFYLSNFFSLLVIIMGINMDGSFAYFSSAKIIHHNKLAVVGICWSLLMCLTTYLLLPQYFLWFDKDMLAVNPQITSNGLKYITGILLTGCFTILFYSLGNYFLPNIILAISSLLLIAAIFFAKELHFNAILITEGYFYLILLQGILLALTFVFKNGFSNFILPQKKELKQLVTYAVVGLGGNIIFFFVYKIDYWFVKDWCHQSGHLGNYIQASKLAQMLLVLPQILAISILPQLASGHQQQEVVQTIIRLIKFFLVLFVVLFLFTLGAGKFIFPLVFGASFNTMYLPFLILLPGIFCLSISSLLSAYFSGKNQNKFNLFAAAFALITMLALTFLFKNRYSIYIAAAISSVAYICEALYCFAKFNKQEKINLKQLFIFTEEDIQWLKKLLAK